MEATWLFLCSVMGPPLGGVQRDDGGVRGGGLSGKILDPLPLLVPWKLAGKQFQTLSQTPATPAAGLCVSSRPLLPPWAPPLSPALMRPVFLPYGRCTRGPVMPQDWGLCQCGLVNPCAPVQRSSRPLPRGKSAIRPSLSARLPVPYAHAQSHQDTQTRTQAKIHMHMHTHIHVKIHMHTHTLALRYTCTHTHIRTKIHAHTHAHA